MSLFSVTNSRSTSRCSWILAVMFCSTVFLGLAPGTVDAQDQQKNYKMIPKERTILPNAKKLRMLKSELKEAISTGGAPTEAQRKTFQQFYIYHVLASMTRPEGWSDPELMPEWRRQVVSDLDRLRDNPTKHRYVRDLIFSTASKIAANADYAPVTRYNALLIVGELNEREKQGSGREIRPAIPYARARDELLKLANNPKEEEAIRIGALIGLARHARLMAAADAKPNTNIARTFISILKTEPSPNGDNDGLWWMQRIAVDAIGNMGKAAAAPSLETVLADSSRPIYLRCAAAEALSKIDFRNAKVDVNGIAKGLGDLALVSLTKQINSIRKHLEENPTDERNTRRREFEAEDAEPEEDPFVTQVRRQLKYELNCVSEGIDGVKAAQGDTTAKNNLTSLGSELQRIDQELSGKGMQPEDLFNRITSPARRLETIVKNIP